MRRTLIDFKHERGLTNKHIAQALGCSASKAGMILQGRYISVWSTQHMRDLAHVFDVPVQECIDAIEESSMVWCKQQTMLKSE